MKIVGIIPARYGSSRLPGKPLALIAGKPLLQWVLEGAANSKKLTEIAVATDHAEIASLSEKLGFKSIMTDSDLPSGSDRVWAAARGMDCDVVVNIQGDEPLITGGLLDQLVAPFEDSHGLQMATLGRAIEPGDLESTTTAKIVLNANDEAIYFSRFPIPYSRAAAVDTAACLKHIGLYAYSKQFLSEFCAQQPVAMEQAEGLEQLRALYLGARIRVVRVDHQSWGVDTPEDVKKIEAILEARG